MISFTPPIKASLLITLVYMICFQFFIQYGSYAWLYPANIFFVACSALYMLFLNRKNKKLDMLTLTGKGARLSFITSILCFAGAAVILLVNIYLFPGFEQVHHRLSNVKGTLALVFANAFVANFVCGSLAAFITAGLMNEKSYTVHSTHLPSVKQ